MSHDFLKKNRAGCVVGGDRGFRYFLRVGLSLADETSTFPFLPRSADFPVPLTSVALPTHSARLPVHASSIPARWDIDVLTFSLSLCPPARRDPDFGRDCAPASVPSFTVPPRPPSCRWIATLPAFAHTMGSIVLGPAVPTWIAAAPVTMPEGGGWDGGGPSNYDMQGIGVCRAMHPGAGMM